MIRPIRRADYPGSRARFFGPSNDPARAPEIGRTAIDVLSEFRDRVAPMTFNAQHPGAFSYFTPPPLVMSIGGEVLAQWLHQGVDVWHAGRIGAFVEEEVVGWLRDVVGSGAGSWGVLTSGGTMANLMALAIARDIHLARILGSDGPPRGAALEGVRVYASDQTHFSVERGLDILGFPGGTLQVIASDDRFRLRAAPVADAIATDRAAGLTPLAISAVAGSTNTGSVDQVVDLASLARSESLWLLVEYNDDLAAYLAARLRDAPDFELAVEPELSVVCFRHLPEGWDRWPAGRLDAYQNHLQRALELDGAAWVSVTTLRGRTCLRAGVVNYLSSTAEIDGLIDALRRLSEGVLEDLDRR